MVVEIVIFVGLIPIRCAFCLVLSPFGASMGKPFRASLLVVNPPHISFNWKLSIPVTYVFIYDIHLHVCVCLCSHMCRRICICWMYVCRPEDKYLVSSTLISETRSLTGLQFTKWGPGICQCLPSFSELGLQVYTIMPGFLFYCRFWGLNSGPPSCLQSKHFTSWAISQPSASLMKNSFAGYTVLWEDTVMAGNPPLNTLSRAVSNNQWMSLSPLGFSRGIPLLER